MKSLLFFSALLIAGEAAAQTAPPQAPCLDDPRFAEFDFWVGEWDVHTADGTLAGTNVITREEKGCVIVERWTGESGGTGMSINYFDHANGEWVQVWNSSGGAQIDIRGNLTEDGMLLTGSIHYVARSMTADFRGLWTPLADGRVRQYFEQSTDGGETWQPWFEGFYSRKTADRKIDLKTDDAENES